MEIDLTQACVGELNTIQRGEINWPIIYGVGVNIRTGEIFPASFPDKGPDIPLRQARNFTGGQTVCAIFSFNSITICCQKHLTIAAHRVYVCLSVNLSLFL